MLDQTASEAYLNCQRSPKTKYETLESKRPDWEPRFWPKVRKTDGCWYWTAAKNNSGYGVFGAYKIGYKKTKFEYAHRLSFIIHKGEVAEGFVVDHKCGNSACVNPAHLQAISHKENCGQGAKKFRRVRCSVCGKKKETIQNPNESKPRNICRPCGRSAQVKYKAKSKSARLGE